MYMSVDLRSDLEHPHLMLLTTSIPIKLIGLGVKAL